MDKKRVQEISLLVEACKHTDNSDLESEKTAVVEELLGEVERLKSMERPDSRHQLDIDDLWEGLDVDQK